jgi:4-hydroxy-tetrahydrodipicolinate reductase
MVRIGIAGISGRMGREVLAVTQADPDAEFIGGFVRPGRIDELASAFGQPVPLYDRLEELLGQVDVLIEFTSPDATLEIARHCAANRKPLVSGTTGLSAEQLAELHTLAQRTPIFYARNMSIGINAVLAALPGLVQALVGYDIEIVETHHRHKADAPSGTALAIAETIAAAVERPLDQHASYGRRGIAPRQRNEIGIHAVRGGGNTGEHTVILADEGEELRVSHRAYSRRTFALGALRAARFVSGQRLGFYAMSDLLHAGHPAR